MIDITNRDAVALEFARICSLASVVIMQVYESGFEVRGKDDKSPVTDADERAEKIILAELEAQFPGIPVLAEESFSAGIRPAIDSVFILVDPVDGTKEFINKNGEFTVNIALIDRGVPVAGCVYAPAIKTIYVGGEQAWSGPLAPGASIASGQLAKMRIRPRGDTLTAVMSRSHADEQTLAFVKELGISDCVSAGSSLKFCLVAEGSADVYPRFAPTMEWDTGAGHAVLSAAGGQVTNPDGTPFLYGKAEQGYRNGHFIARGAI